MKKIILLLVVLVLAIPFANAFPFFPSGGNDDLKALGEACESNNECESSLCVGVPPNAPGGQPKQCVSCDEVVKFGNPLPVGPDTGWEMEAFSMGPYSCQDQKVCNQDTHACEACFFLSPFNPETGKCEPLFASCSVDSDCDDDEYCNNGLCFMKPANECPSGIISMSPPAVESPGSVMLSANEEDPDGDDVSCKWFIDGSLASNGCEFSNYFSQMKTYNVKLEITDNNGCTQSYTDEVAVGECLSYDHIMFTISGTSNAAVGTAADGYNIEICHNDNVALGRSCTGTNTVIKHDAGKAYAPESIVDVDNICYGDYYCYVTSDSCAAGTTCKVSMQSEEDSVVGVCGEYENSLCCGSALCEDKYLSCASKLLTQSEALKGYHACGKVDGVAYSEPDMPVGNCCGDSCAFDGACYDEGSVVEINGYDVECTGATWCPEGFVYNPDKYNGVCEPAKATCFDQDSSVICPFETLNDNWFTHPECVKPQASQACCSVNIGGTDFYGYDLLEDDQEVLIY